MVKETVATGWGSRKYAMLAVKCKYIIRPIVGIRDPQDERNDLEKLYYFLLGQDKWAQCFYNDGMATKEEDMQMKDDEDESEDDAENEDRGEEERWDGEGGHTNEDDYSDCDSEEQHDDEEDDDSRIQSDEEAEDQD